MLLLDGCQDAGQTWYSKYYQEGNDQRQYSRASFSLSVGQSVLVLCENCSETQIVMREKNIMKHSLCD